MSTVPPPKKPTPPPPAKPNGMASTPATNKKFSVTSGVNVEATKAVIFGSGGVGKSELAANIKQLGINPLVIDIGDSTQHIDIDRIAGIANWDELRAVLHDESLFTGRDCVIIDDLSAAEEMAKAWTMQNVKHEKGHTVSSIEGYGFGKGYTHVFETFMQLLGDLDAHHRKGRHIICIAHECTAKVPNPSGEDYIRYEPRLQVTDKCSIRHRMKEWTYQLLFIGYDTFAEDGKATGGGTRTIYTTEMPTHLAKRRVISGRDVPESLPYEQGSADIWKLLLGKD